MRALFTDTATVKRPDRAVTVVVTNGLAIATALVFVWAAEPIGPFKRGKQFI